MTKYARLRDGYLVDVYAVPGSYADLATLNRCLPGGGFIVVPDSALHGAKDNNDGTYTNPAPSAPAQLPKILTKKELRTLATMTLAAGLAITQAAASARLQAYFDAARANVGNTQGDKNMRWALSAWQEDTYFGKDEATQIMLGLQFDVGDRGLISAAWPMV